MSVSVSVSLCACPSALPLTPPILWDWTAESPLHPHKTPHTRPCIHTRKQLRDLPLEPLESAWWNWPFFTQSSGRNFLPDLCGEVHPEAVPLQDLCCALCSTEQSTFRGGEQVPRKREEGWPTKGAKREKDAWKQIRKAIAQKRFICTLFARKHVKELFLYEWFSCGYYEVTAQNVLFVPSVKSYKWTHYAKELFLYKWFSFRCCFALPFGQNIQDYF